METTTTTKCVYLSGPISDPATGLPREGWQRDFLDAEARLRRMGLTVVNPVDIAREVDEGFAWRWEYQSHLCTSDGPLRPSRADYILACLQRMKLNHEYGHLHAIYVIGSERQALLSDGVRMELLMASVLGLPAYAACRDGHRVNFLLIEQIGFGGIEELTKEE